MDIYLVKTTHYAYSRKIHQQKHMIVHRHGNKTRAYGYLPKPTPIWRVFPDLTGFGFFSISL